MIHFPIGYWKHAASVLAIFAAGAVLPGPAEAAVLLSGDAEFVPAGTDFGGRLRAGTSSGGAAVIDGGSSVTLQASTSADDGSAQPRVIIGENYDGDLVVSGAGSTLAVQGDGSGASVLAGRHDTDPPGLPLTGDGLVNVMDGGRLVVSDLQVSTSGRTVDISLAQRGADGSLVVSGGEVLIESDATSVLRLEDGTANVLLTDGSSLDVVARGAAGLDPSARAVIGRDGVERGNGAVTVEMGSSLTVEAPAGQAEILVGERGGTGTLTVDGSGSVVGIAGGSTPSGLIVGFEDESIGEVTVSNGGLVSIQGDEARLAVGERGEATGFVTIESGGAMDIGGPNGVAQIGEFMTGVESDTLGVLTVKGAGSRLSASSSVQVGSDGGAGSTSGLVVVNDGGVIEAPVIDISEGGIVTGNGGTIIGDTVLSAGGILSPGLSPGMLTIDGDLTFEGGLLEIEIGGAGVGESDLLRVTGSVFATSPFEIAISFTDEFLPDGSNFSFLSAGTVSEEFAEFASMSIFGLGDGASADLVTSADGSFSVEVSQAPVAAPIPLPSGALLLGSVLLAGGAFKGHRRGRGRRT